MDVWGCVYVSVHSLSRSCGATWVRPYSGGGAKRWVGGISLSHISLPLWSLPQCSAFPLYTAPWRGRAAVLKKTEAWPVCEPYEGTPRLGWPLCEKPQRWVKHYCVGHPGMGEVRLEDVWGMPVCVKRMGALPKGECRRYRWICALTAIPLSLALVCRCGTL